MSDPHAARNRRNESNRLLESISQRLEQRLEQRLASVAEHLKAQPVSEATADEATAVAKILHTMEEIRMGIRWQKQLEKAILANPSLLAQTPGPFPLTRKVGSMAARVMKAMNGDQRRTAARNQKRGTDMLLEAYRKQFKADHGEDLPEDL